MSSHDDAPKPKQPQQQTRKPKPGDLLDLQIESLAYGGRGVGRVGGEGGFVVFVEGAAPGERVMARVFKRRKGHAEARTEQVVAPSAKRIDPRCPLFGTCGGCSWQHLGYAEQLAQKHAQVRDSLERLGGLRGLPGDFYLPPVAAPDPWNYRNKMDFAFGRERDTGELIVGFHRKGSFRNVLDVERCYIHPEPFDQVLATFRDFGRKHCLEGHDPRTHQGYLRNLIVRHSRHSGEVIVVVLTRTPEPLPGGLAPLAEELQSRGVKLAGMIHGLNGELADTAAMSREIERVGRDHFFEKLGDKIFRVSAFSFFQTNSAGAEKLYGVVRDFANLKPGQRVLDAFCGAGTIGIFAGSDAGAIHGVEIVPDAVRDAIHNAKLNGMADRCDFRAGDARYLLPELRAELSATRGATPFDVVIVDPPRGGMHAKALEALLDLAAPRFVYVSCNPTTMARDAQQIVAAGYAPIKCATVDMFPQTYHIEAVLLFERSA